MKQTDQPIRLSLSEKTLDWMDHFFYFFQYSNSKMKEHHMNTNYSNHKNQAKRALYHWPIIYKKVIGNP